MIPIKYMKMPNMYAYGKDRNGFLNEFQIKEKLDGDNFRFKVHEDCIVYGSRNQVLIRPNGTYEKFMDIIEFYTSAGALDPDLIYFTEAMTNGHRIKYDLRDEYRVMGFDVYDTKREIWRGDWQELFHDLGLPTVKVYTTDDFDKNISPYDIATYLEAHSGEYRSNLDGESPIEGIVMMDYEQQVFYKYKTKAYQEANPEKKIKGTNWVLEQFVEKYGTTYRIEKITKRAATEGKYNPKNPLPSIVEQVVRDIFEEATMSDIIKTFGRSVQYELIKKVTNTDYLMNNIIELKSK